MEAVGELGVADELRGVRLLQAAERDPLDHVLAAEVGEQPRRVGDEVGLLVAHRHQHEQRRALEAADDVAEQQQRRHARPLEVLDDQQQRPLGGDAPEQRGDGLEQPVAAVLPLAGVRGGAAQLRDERGERLEVHARHRGRVGHVVAERFDERLERARRSPRRSARAAPRRRPRAPRRRSARRAGSSPCPPPPRPRRSRPAPAPTPAAARRARPRGRRTGAPRAWRGRSAAAARRGGRRRGRRLVLHQQPVVQRGDVGRRRRAELVAQQHPQAVVDAQRLGHVPARGQQLHLDRVAGLAVRLALDQRARRAIGGRQLAAAQPQRRAGQRLQRVGVQPVELGALLVDPAPRELGQQRPLEALERRARPFRRPPRVARRQRLLGLGRGRACLVEVDPHVAGASRRCARPATASGPSACRTRVSSAASPASGEPGGWSSHTTSTSSSRRTGRSWLRARYANSSRPWRPGRSSSTRRPSTSTVRAPHSSTRMATGSGPTVTGREDRPEGIRPVRMRRAPQRRLPRAPPPPGRRHRRRGDRAGRRRPTAR